MNNENMAYKKFSRGMCKERNTMAWYPSLILSEDRERVLGKQWLPIQGWDVYDKRCALMKDQSGKDKIRLILKHDVKPVEINLHFERNKVTILEEQTRARTTGVRAKSNHSRRQCNRI